MRCSRKNCSNKIDTGGRHPSLHKIKPIQLENPRYCNATVLVHDFGFGAILKLAVSVQHCESSENLSASPNGLIWVHI